MRPACHSIWLYQNFHDCSIAAHDNCTTIIRTCVCITMPSLWKFATFLKHFQRYQMLRSKSHAAHIFPGKMFRWFFAFQRKNALIFHIVFKLETVSSENQVHVGAQSKHSAIVVIVSSCKSELPFKMQPPKWRIERKCMKWLNGKICKVRSENKKSL